MLSIVILFHNFPFGYRRPNFGQILFSWVIVNYLVKNVKYKIILFCKCKFRVQTEQLLIILHCCKVIIEVQFCKLFITYWIWKDKFNKMLSGGFVCAFYTLFEGERGLKVCEMKLIEQKLVFTECYLCKEVCIWLLCAKNKLLFHKISTTIPHGSIVFWGGRGWFETLTPPLQKFQLSFIFSFEKIWLWESLSPPPRLQPVGSDSIYLEPHIIGQL